MSIVNYERFDNDGIELVINIVTGESFATQAGYSRMSGKDPSTISRRYQGVAKSDQKTAEVLTPGGLQGVALIPGKIATKWLAKDNPDLLAAMSEAGWNVYCHKLAGYEVTTTAVDRSTPALQPVTDETVKVHIQGIKYLTDNGDLQLAQLLKAQFGNRLLAEQQNLLRPVDVPQYEGVIDVAIRLGFKVPANFEGSLGTEVGKTCKHLRLGHDKRYSTTSSKQVGANMYPANHPDVEAAVLDYCVSKAFYRQEMNWM